MKEQIGTYHLADNPQLFEIQRSNNFEFVVTDMKDLLRAGALGTEKNAKFKNAQEMLRLSVSKSSVPSFQQQVVSVKRGNSTLKYAGTPEFAEGTLEFHDFIGADTSAILQAWQNLSYNVSTEKVGSLQRTQYKKNCYLIEYAPDYEKVRTWKLYGCWISNLTRGEYSNESGDKHMITATIQYDRAEICLTDEI